MTARASQARAPIEAREAREGRRQDRDPRDPPARRTSCRSGRSLPLATLALAFPLSSGALFGACASDAVGAHEIRLDGRAIGTTWVLRVVDEERDADPALLRELVERSLETVDLAASTWREDSEISRALSLEPGAEQPISEDLVAILDVAREAYEHSGGAFDPTVGPLVALYGFGAGAEDELPAAEALAEAAARVDFPAFAWEAGQLTRTRDDVSLDLSGVAKGHAVDLAADALLAAGETRFLLEIGGELRASGRRLDGAPWAIGIYEPVETLRVHGRVMMTEVAVATSGDYRAFRDLPDGTRLSHTIDPRTGRAATSGVASATVLADTCARADALATAIMVLGPDAGLELVESLPEVEAYLLTHGGQTEAFSVRASSGFPTVELFGG